MFDVVTTTRASSSKSFILCLHMIIIRAKQAKVDLAYFVQRDQHEIIAKHLRQSSILLFLMLTFRCNCRRRFLNSLFFLSQFITYWIQLQFYNVYLYYVPNIYLFLVLIPIRWSGTNISVFVYINFLSVWHKWRSTDNKRTSALQRKKNLWIYW